MNDAVLEIEGLTVRSAEGDALVKNVGLCLKRQECLGIAGESGSGKTITAKAILHLLPQDLTASVTHLRVLGEDLLNLPEKERRIFLGKKIGFVPQKGVLFSGTVASNLRFGNPAASDDEIREAAEIAQAADFIEEKEDRYDSYIAQGGSNVSGGQKQRLAIARAIAKNPKVFVFDDSFSALDMKTDAKLRKALEERVKDAAEIVVAQRISTILHADQILVLDDGEIAGRGTHEELLQTCEVYRQIAKSQLSEKELGDLSRTAARSSGAEDSQLQTEQEVK